MNYYKYTTTSTTKLILENLSLRWSSPLQFNDIEECQFVPFTNEEHRKAHEKYIEILTEFAKGKHLDYDYNKFSHITLLLIEAFKISIDQGTFTTENFVDVMLNITNNPDSDYRNYINTALIRIFRILCVTDNYDNNLMWAHYGDQNYGCVIELDKVFIDAPRNLKEGKVTYHENLNPQSNPLDMLLYGETEEVRNLMIKDVIFSKRTNWSYENEYRFMFAESFGSIKSVTDMQTKETKISVSNQTDRLFADVKILSDNIKSITFGIRTSKKDISEIVEIVKKLEYKCKFYQMKLENGIISRNDLILL
ncbi:DUF2971 domain-containing protein [Sphingobacterium sp. MYb382]|uniref:DUF2971 domain-containing protein n=1 Tax=Sphingobacterium sp. MYb382 TaxID=2745278 RepID=UPI00309F758B